MPPVIVYSKPNCSSCVASKRALDKYGVPYDEIDITQDREALERVVALGHSAAPVITVGDESWSGFRLDRIKGLLDLMPA